MDLSLVEDWNYSGISKMNIVKILIYVLIRQKEKQDIISSVFAGTLVNRQLFNGITKTDGQISQWIG